MKFVRFPAITFQYSDLELRFLNATSIWLGRLLLQMITTLTTAYSTFNVLIDRFIIHEIKVKVVVVNKTMRNLKLKYYFRLNENLHLLILCWHLALNCWFKLSSRHFFYSWFFGWYYFITDGRICEVFWREITLLRV